MNCSVSHDAIFLMLTRTQTSHQYTKGHCPNGRVLLRAVRFCSSKCRLRAPRRLGRWDDGLHLVRVHTFPTARVESCHHVIVCLSGLNRSVDVGNAQVGRSHGGVGSTGDARSIYVVSHYIRAGFPREIYAVLNRRHTASTQRRSHGRICRVA